MIGDLSRPTPEVARGELAPVTMTRTGDAAFEVFAEGGFFKFFLQDFDHFVGQHGAATCLGAILMVLKCITVT
jgi:hypothetical protein